MNEIDVTPQVIGSLTNIFVNHTITFREPSETAVLALKGWDQSVLMQPMVELICVASRVGSPWNFDSQPDANWSSVVMVPPSPVVDNLPAGWYSLYFNGTLNETYPATNAKRMYATECGHGTSEMRLRANQGPNSMTSGYYSVRRTVVQPQPCGTNGPTTQPSKAPSKTATTKPSRSPSSSPTSSPAEGVSIAEKITMEMN